MVKNQIPMIMILNSGFFNSTTGVKHNQKYTIYGVNDLYKCHQNSRYFINPCRSYPEKNETGFNGFILPPDITVKVKNKNKNYCERMAKESKCDPSRWTSLTNIDKCGEIVC